MLYLIKSIRKSSKTIIIGSIENKFFKSIFIEKNKINHSIGMAKIVFFINNTFFPKNLEIWSHLRDFY